MSSIGRKHSQETRKKISLNHARYWSGKKREPFSKETRAKMSLAKIGKLLPEKHRQSISNANKGMFVGAKHPNWKGGITPLRKKLYFSEKYKLWRTAVFARDNFTCLWCGYVSKGKNPPDINADHIKPWSLFPKLRFVIGNGRTLCVNCHKKTRTYGVKS